MGPSLRDAKKPGIFIQAVLRCFHTVADLHPHSETQIQIQKKWEFLSENIPLFSCPDADMERGKDYNHSTFNDLIISGLVGLRPSADGTLVVNPLLPADVWDWFCLDRVRYRGHDLTILWDRDGSRFNRGAGLQVFVNGSLAARSDRLERVVFEIF